MSQFNLVKPKIADAVKSAGLVCEKEIMIKTKLMLRQSKKQVAGAAVKAAASALLLGFYSMPAPAPFFVSLKENTLILIPPHKNFFTGVLSVKEKQIENRIEINKEEILSTELKKVLGGKKLHLELSSGEELMIDVTKKLEPAFEEILKVIGSDNLETLN